MIEFKPYDYQRKAIDWILTKPRCALFLDMGLGKTISTLTALEDLIYNSLEVSKVLVIAPVRVAKYTWSGEIKKWSNIKHLRYSVVVGTPKQRLKALEKEADIYIINRENIVWLVDNYDFNFDTVVIDELSSFKNNQSKRFKALRKYISRAKRVIGLTGTPAPNGLIDLWAQMYLIDQGQRLGKTIGSYRSKYFRPGRSNGFIVYEYVPLPDTEQEVYSRLDDICLSMKKEDYLELPDRRYLTEYVELDTKSFGIYKEFEKEAVLELQENNFIIGTNAGASVNKLQQIANGRIYDENKKVTNIHDLKLEKLEDLIEAANGQPVIVFYAFQHDKEAIRQKFETRELESDRDLDDWNNKKIPILLAHPASIGHGLNLQAGGHIIIWYGLTWSLELYQQANDRLYRQGQTNNVIIYHIVTKGTVDERVLKALENKEKVQDSIMEYLKEETLA